MLKNKSFGTCKYNHAIMFDMLIIISCNLLKEQQKWLAEYLPTEPVPSKSIQVFFVSYSNSVVD
jgi:hypothetical protein